MTLNMPLARSAQRAALTARSAKTALPRPSLPSPRRTTYLRSPTTVPCRRAFSATTSFHVKKYTEDHEWIELDPSGTTGTVGISTYAAKALGDVVYVELPEAGSEVSKGDTIGAVESVKSASDIMTPVTGVVKEANNLLEEKPGTINKSPEAEGWIARMEVKDSGELEGLMDAEVYAGFTGEQEGKGEH